MLIDQTIYPEVQKFPSVYGTTGLIVTRFFLEEHHCNGHFLHRPMLPLSEIGAMSSRLAALLCQLNSREIPELWEKDPIAVVAKYEPSEVVYIDPAVENQIYISITASMVKYSANRVSTVDVSFHGGDCEFETAVSQSFRFKLINRLDMPGWK